MPRLAFAAAAASLTVLAWASWGPARAFELVVGGLAGHCSSDAKAGVFTQQAIDICSRALSGEPLNEHDRAGTYVNRGAIEAHNMDWEAAQADFTEALRIMPGMGEAHIGMGAYLVRQERWAEAEAEVTRGLDLGTEEPEKGYYFRGLARWGQENFRGAYFDFQHASELKPGWSLPRQQMANFKVTPAAG